MFRPQEALDNDSRDAEYPRLAEATLGGTLPGSSAAGEQPKFTACVRDVDGGQRHVIVKFSGAIGQPEGRRWADLLLAEHVANTILTQSGVPCAITDVVDGGERLFLESTRFDREGDHGRRNIVSLEALDAAFFGEIDTPWTDAAGRLHADDWISESDADLLSLQWWFGTLIGNTDMHYGNVSLFLGPNRPLLLAPIYDMVPMLYRPRADGSIVYDQLDPQAPPPEARPQWTRAASMAEAFWSRLSQTSRVSSEFRELAGRNGELVSTYRERYAG